VSDQEPTKLASKWNARYAYANQSAPRPADVLIKGAEYLPQLGLAVDIACGLGGNAFFLAEQGFSVQAWDISSAAITSIQQRSESQTPQPSVVAALRDVVADPPEPNSFDVIVVSRFLDRSLCSSLVAALRPNGVLFYQTFTAGLSNPDFLLESNELSVLFNELHPCYVFESAVDERGFSEAQFVGQRR